MYEVGTSPFFDAIIPGTVSEQEEVKQRPVTPLQRQPDDQGTVFEPQVVPEGKKDLPTEAPTQDPTSSPNTETKHSVPETFTSTITYTEEAQPSEKTTSSVSAAPQPTHTFTETLEATHPPAEPTSREPGPAELQYTNPELVQPLPPNSQPLQPQVIVVNEDEELDVNGKSQKRKAFVGFFESVASVFGCFHSLCVQFGDVRPQPAEVLGFR